MNSGVGKASYANNSSLQKKVISKVKGIIEEKALEIYCKHIPDCMRIAELGCSSGPTALTAASYTLDLQPNEENIKKPLMTFQVFLNDLPGNDFNNIFQQSLPSLYERLNEKFDDHPLCFVPNGLVSETGEAYNKGNIYITKTSSDMVLKAHLSQFQEDFTTFLKCRSEEMVIGGCMVLTILGSILNNNPKHILEIVGRALNDMVSEGIIEEISVDKFNVPMYSPTAKEVKEVIEEEGSFWLEKLEVYEIAWDDDTNNINNNIDDDDDIIDHKLLNRGKFVCGYMRAVMEPILSKHLEKVSWMICFNRFTQKVIESLANENWNHVNLVVSLTKK
ncbi:hypothetical protein F8388_020827 [Cannabis sativa]|uniref:Uncharacterized protein n=1 Tax=Cannabis sativa TaxID=3483 RepID=A0A7J6FMW8_CANSA|nr:hypothetical protein F8388_020827 [Cannabis sativa]